MNILRTLENHFEKTFEDLGFDKSLAKVSFSARPELCEFQLNAAFAIAKTLKKNPLEIAKIIAEKANCPDYEIVACPPAFVNISLSEKMWQKVAKQMQTEENLGLEKSEHKKKILIDYGGANVAKELHMGHLRSPIIGESLKRLYKILGHEVWGDSHLGDWGTQMGLTIAQLEEDGHLADFLSGKAKKPKITLEMLNVAYPKASARKKTDIAFKNKADEFTLLVQHKTEPWFSVYQEIKRVSVERIEANYKKLNCYFDLWYGESDAEPFLDTTVQIFKDKGLARVSDGALVVDVAREGEHIPIPKKHPDDKQLYQNPMPPAIIKKANDGDVYATTDLATILMRNKMFELDEIHYVVDKRQATHFEQVFRCAKLAGIAPENQVLLHIGYGTMNGKDGKPFKTREGTTIKLEDVIDLLSNSAADRLAQNQIVGNPELALQIGVAAMKFGDLSNQISKDYVFDLDRFLSFEGKTGPFLQYTAARIKSLLAKSDSAPGKILAETPAEKTILLDATKLLSAYPACYKEKSLATLATATYNLASSFSSLYSNVRILSEQNKQRKASLLGLSALVLAHLEQALFVLGIDTPERM